MVVLIDQSLLLSEIRHLGDVRPQFFQVDALGRMLRMSRRFRQHRAHLFVVRLARALYGLSGFAERSSRHELMGRRRNTSRQSHHADTEDACHRRVAAGREVV